MKPVLMYTKDYCPYCDKAKNYFNENNIPFEEKDVSLNPLFLKEMLERSNGRKTVPEIFIDNQHIGGWDDLFVLIQKGDIDELLGRA
jgi:GrxC family glutaredoxin